MCKEATKSDWERCVEFHGHVCGGLTIGYQAARLAIRLLNLTFSKDENVVAICENDACGVDAIQVMLGCSVGKGNLLFHMCGKQAFNIYERNSGRSVRLVLRETPGGLSREESLRYLTESDPAELFDVRETVLQVPERARLFDSYICDCCGEKTGSNWIRLQGDKKLCLDCYRSYDRFHV